MHRAIDLYHRDHEAIFTLERAISIDEDLLDRDLDLVLRGDPFHLLASDLTEMTSMAGEERDPLHSNPFSELSHHRCFRILRSEIQTRR